MLLKTKEIRNKNKDLYKELDDINKKIDKKKRKGLLGKFIDLLFIEKEVIDDELDFNTIKINNIRNTDGYLNKTKIAKH